MIGIGVRDVEVVADQRHAERRMEILEEDLVDLGDAVAIRIAQQPNAIGTLRRARWRAAWRAS